MLYVFKNGYAIGYMVDDRFVAMSPVKAEMLG